MKRRYILFLLIFMVTQSVFGQPVKNVLKFKTSAGHVIKVIHGQILFDHKIISKLKYDDVLYDSKSNCIIEDHGSIFLFIAMFGGPNDDRLNVFLITPAKAKLVADAILSPVKDYDNDGYLEFGGRDLTEEHPNPDSMYYVPTAYFEIRNGKIHADNALTRSEDIKINGLYLPPNKQLDKDGFCCKVIPMPGRKHKHHVQIQSDIIPKSFMGSDTISVYAMNDVLANKSDINYVVHDNDGKWFFYSSEKEHKPATLMTKVDLASIIKADRSVLLLSWVPKGYFAQRSAKDTPWGWDKLF
jgi:hypothetical protein